MIDRIVHLGFEVRIEMTLADGSPLIAQLTRAQVEELELADGQIVYVLPSRARVFDATAARRGRRSSRWRSASRRPDEPRRARRLGDVRRADRLARRSCSWRPSASSTARRKAKREQRRPLTGASGRLGPARRGAARRRWAHPGARRACRSARAARRRRRRRGSRSRAPGGCWPAAPARPRAAARRRRGTRSRRRRSPRTVASGPSTARMISARRDLVRRRARASSRRRVPRWLWTSPWTRSSPRMFSRKRIGISCAAASTSPFAGAPPSCPRPRARPSPATA